VNRKAAKLRGLVVGIVLVMLGLAVDPTPAMAGPQDFRTPGAGILVDVPYKIWNSESIKCMEVHAASMANGALVDQWTCNGGSHQAWTWRATPVAGFYQLVNGNSRKCLDNAGNYSNGAQLTQWTCEDNNPHQRFWVQPNPSIGSRWSFGTGGLQTICIEVYHAGINTNGTKVNQWTCNGNANQVWLESSAL
jgi:hypothetical protein